MSIEFYCPGCGNLMRTPDATAGKKGRCPSCSIKIQIPGESLTVSAAVDGLVPVESVTPPAKMDFFCSNCGRQVRVAESAAGQRGKCPSCETVVPIPELKADSDGDQ